jgi:hypothetical protein
MSQYISTIKDVGSYTFIMPDGFEANVEIHFWGAGGGEGYNDTAGGGGGYVKSNITIQSGDTVEIVVGGAGGVGSRNFGGTAGQGGSSGFDGGGGGNGIPQPYNDDQNYGAGGGGGGATAIIVNGVAVAVAAGGGGGGGGASYQTGDPGLPGGVSGKFTTTSSGGIGTNAYAAGGGGGGGYFGGMGGIGIGDDAGRGIPGYGGQSLGDISIPGSGVTGGGRTTIYAPNSPPYGNAGYSGYAVLIFERTFNINVKDSNTYKKITDAYIKIGPKRDSVTRVTQTFSTIGDSTFTVPAGVYSVNVTYPTPAGLNTHLQAVSPGSRLNVKIGDFNQASTFGTGLTTPAYSKRVFRYYGNVDHLTSMNISVVAASGTSLTTAGYNSSQQAEALANGLTLTYTYEGWHGDLFSTIEMTPAPNNTIFTEVRVVAGGGGRAQGPSVTAQPTSPAYVMSGQIYDTAGGEGYYDINFTLQQRGYFSITYDLPIVISGWAPIKQIWTKVSGSWKALIGAAEILITKNRILTASATPLLYTYSLISGQGGSDNGGSNANPFNPIYWNYLSDGYRSGDILYPTADPYHTTITANNFSSLGNLYTDLTSGGGASAFGNVAWVSNVGTTQSFTATLNPGYHFYATNDTITGPIGSGLGGNGKSFINPGATITFFANVTATGISSSTVDLKGTGASSITVLKNQGMVWTNYTGVGGTVNVLLNVSGVSKAMGYRITVDGNIITQQQFGERTSSFSGVLGPYAVTANSSVMAETFWWGAGASFTNSSYITSGTFQIGGAVS